MAEPTNPNPPAITEATPLGDIGAKYGVTTLGELVTKYNEAQGKLANPQSPEKFDFSAVEKHYKDAGAEFESDNPAFAGVVAALQKGGVSQVGFDKIIPAMQTAFAEQAKAEMEAWEAEAVKTMGDKENFDKLLNAAKHYGIDGLVQGANGEQLVAITKIINAAAGAGGLTGPGDNPGDDNPNPSPEDHTDPEWSREYDGKRYGLAPQNWDSLQAFMRLEVEQTLPNGQKHSRPLHQADAGMEALYRKALAWRANNGFQPGESRE